MKLFTILAKTELLSVGFKNMKKDYIQFFKNKQTAFRGIRKTYAASEGAIDEPAKREYKAVITTANEKLDYFVEHTTDYINNLFSLEKTNATGKAVAPLIVDGKKWGDFTSLELMRLKSLIDDQDFKNLYGQLPVREETKIWVLSDVPNIWIDELQHYQNTTTEKEQYILNDPNLDKIDGAKYSPQVAVKETKKILGLGTQQNFSGEMSHLQRAKILANLARLQVAVLEALKQANDCEVVESEMTAKKLFDFLHG